MNIKIEEEKKDNVLAHTKRKLIETQTQFQALFVTGRVPEMVEGLTFNPFCLLCIHDFKHLLNISYYLYSSQNNLAFHLYGLRNVGCCFR